ncbi:unnamed protein product [Ostreobium quekettii]|uniref:Protein kinase domain-containing protein n=1 Tax=Ostreobium quekettii TaxID=121088 RepID=A0A8S1IME9_9CHLO|nr:unnamed protein product [Ostreobium quekettii]
MEPSADNQLIARHGDQNRGRASGSFCIMLDQYGVDKNVVGDILRMLPVQPDKVSNVRGPYLEVSKVDNGSVDVKVVRAFQAHFPKADDPRGFPLPLGDFQEEKHQIMAEGGQVGSFAHIEGRPVFLDHGVTVDDMHNGMITRQLSSAGSLMLEVPRAHGLESVPEAGKSGPEQSIVHRTFLHPWEIDPKKIEFGPRIAVGGFAEVFVGKYEGTVVAIKRLLESDATTIGQFKKEVTLLARIRHPNLILFIGYCTTPHLCIISEFMQRGCLYSILRRQATPLCPKLQKLVSISVARGMAYLHGLSPPILHLDIKSPNILVDSNWRVKVADFGLSRMRFRSFVTAGPSGGGTPHWMAPELLRSEHIDEKADIFSYGVILWEILTGELPWEGMNPMQVVAAVGFNNRSLPVPTAGDPFLINMFQRCCAWEPSDRPTFHEILAELDLHYSRGVTAPPGELRTAVAVGQTRNVQPTVDEPESPPRGGEAKGSVADDENSLGRPGTKLGMEPVAGKSSGLRDELKCSEAHLQHNKADEKCNPQDWVEVEEGKRVVCAGRAASSLDPRGVVARRSLVIAVEEDPCHKGSSNDGSAGLNPDGVPLSPFAAWPIMPFDTPADEGKNAHGSHASAVDAPGPCSAGSDHSDDSHGVKPAGQDAGCVGQTASPFVAMPGVPLSAQISRRANFDPGPPVVSSMLVQDNANKDIGGQGLAVMPSPFATFVNPSSEVASYQQENIADNGLQRLRLKAEGCTMGCDGGAVKVNDSAYVLAGSYENSVRQCTNLHVALPLQKRILCSSRHRAFCTQP